MKEIGFVNFITGEMWKPNNEIFGILPMIVGSIYVTAGAIICRCADRNPDCRYLWLCIVRNRFINR